MSPTGKHNGKFLDCVILDHQAGANVHKIKVTSRSQVAKDLTLTGKVLDVEWFHVSSRVRFEKVRKTKNAAKFEYVVRPLVQFKGTPIEEELTFGQFLGAKCWRVWHCVRAALTNNPAMAAWTWSQVRREIRSLPGKTEKWDLGFLRLYAKFEIKERTLVFETNDKELAGRIEKCLGLAWTSLVDSRECKKMLAGYDARRGFNPAPKATPAPSLVSESTSAFTMISDIPKPAPPAFRPYVLVRLSEEPLEALYKRNKWSFYDNLGMLVSQSGTQWTVQMFNKTKTVEKSKLTVLSRGELDLIKYERRGLWQYLKQQWGVLADKGQFFGKYRLLLQKLSFLGADVQSWVGTELRIEDFNIQSAEMADHLPKDVTAMRLPNYGRSKKHEARLAQLLRELVAFDFDYSLTKPVCSVTDLFITRAWHNRDYGNIDVCFNFRVSAKTAQKLLTKVTRWGSERLRITKASGGFSRCVAEFTKRNSAMNATNFTTGTKPVGQQKPAMSVAILHPTLVVG